MGVFRQPPSTYPYGLFLEIHGLRQEIPVIIGRGRYSSLGPQLLDFTQRSLKLASPRRGEKCIFLLGVIDTPAQHHHFLVKGVPLLFEGPQQREDLV